MAQRKQQARSEALSRRESLGDRRRAEKSALIARRLINLELFQKARCVFIYVAVRSEVQTHAILKAALKLRKTVCVPLIDPDKKEMSACAITDPACDLHPGTLGIPEPDRVLCPAIKICEIDCAIIPGLAFTEQGCRIGYGGGFYDRFLREWSGIGCALAFEEQIVTSLPFDPDRDVAVGCIITEQRDINCVF
jgi:5-formyltetrahydrofolate cyclo-ligase